MIFDNFFLAFMIIAAIPFAIYRIPIYIFRVLIENENIRVAYLFFGQEKPENMLDFIQLIMRNMASNGLILFIPYAFYFLINVYTRVS